MSNIVKPAAVLLIICVVAAGLLGFVNQITQAPIAKQEAEATEKSMKEVLPDAASFGDTQEVNEGNITTVTPSLDESGNTTGYAVAIETKGFSAGLKLMFGVSTDGTITGLSVVDCSNETPGLGANAANESFKSQFKDASGKVAVTKDGGNIEALTGATITSRAVANAATEAIDYVSNLDAEGGAN
ncbi:MAG: RnfABCDGE type electron transport complex subunit G [Lachnospirales bacterium]